MVVTNVHERLIAAPMDEVGTLIDSLASKNDRLWPRNEWPAMRLDRPLAVGASGGHGPVRYFVTSYIPRWRVEFQFTRPVGFNGHHSFEAVSHAEDATLLRHELIMSLSGVSVLTWPLFFRPLHDALIEESFDRAESECGKFPVLRPRRTLWTRILRASFSTILVRRRSTL